MRVAKRHQATTRVEGDGVDWGETGDAGATDYRTDAKRRRGKGGGSKC